jgi:cell division protein ZipA
MDADQLRLILLLAGMALVAAIYLWDRYKRSRRRLKGLSLRQARRIRKEYGLDESGEEAVPSFTATDDREISPEPGVSIRLVQKEEPPAEEEVQPELDFSATEQDDYLHTDPALQEGVPQMVVQIGLVKKEGVFSGPEILAALEEAELKPGAMEIFHRHDPRYPDRVLFSVANMVEPGHFPFDEMEGFTTPGLLFFTQLPGVRDGLEIYSEMLFAANQVAETLGGVLQDENRAVLTKQSIQHTRDSIAEHRRRLRLSQKLQRA